MIASAQLVCMEFRHPVAEHVPFRLVCRVALSSRQFLEQAGLRQRLEEPAAAGALRRKEYDGGNLQRGGSEPIAPAPQVDLEFLDAAAAPDDRRFANRGGVTAPLEPAQ